MYYICLDYYLRKEALCYLGIGRTLSVGEVDSSRYPKCGQSINHLIYGMVAQRLLLNGGVDTWNLYGGK